MKKTILNIAAIAVIATTTFIACDKKQANDAAAPADSTAIEAPKTEEAPTTGDSATVAPKTEEAPKTDAAAPEAAPKTEEAPKTEATK